MKKIILVFWIAATLACFYDTANKAAALNQGRQRLIESPPLARYSRPIVDVLTLGQKNIYDDFINVWLLQILADKSIPPEKADEVNKVVLEVTALRPKFESLYMLACFVLTLDFNRPDLCEKIMIDGLQAFPESWRLPMTQGFIYAFKLNDPVKAAGFYDLAASRPESPAYVGRFAKKLLNRDEVSRGDMKEALEVMLKIPGGSRFTQFLNENYQNRLKQEKDADHEHSGESGTAQGQ